MTNQETIQRIEDRYPMGSLEFQIKYCRTMMQAQMDDASANPDENGKRPRPRLPLTQVNRCHEMLSMHERALDMRQKLIQADINNELGQDSPHYDAGNIKPDYDEYIRLRLLVKQAPARRSNGEGGGRGRTSATSSAGQGSGTFSSGSLLEKVPDPLHPSDNPHGLRELPPGKSALDSIVESAVREAQAEQHPRSASTPEIAAKFDSWSEKVAHWMNVHDYTIPPPRMDERLWKALEHDAQYDPNVNQWFHTVKQLNLMHEQAKNMAEFSDFAQAMAAQPITESSPGRKAGGSGQPSATSSPNQSYRSQGATTEQNKPEKLAKIIPGPGNPNFNTRA